jgi:hypothetical protein
MKNRYITLIAAVLLLSACTTPMTVLRNNKTGQVVQCGGNISSSMAGGAIGYHIQKGNDNECVAQYKTEGFKVINTVTK